MQLSPLQLDAYYVKELWFSVLPGLDEQTQFAVLPGMHAILTELKEVEPLLTEVTVSGGPKDDNPLRWRMELTVATKEGKDFKFPYKFRIIVVGFYSVSDQYPQDKRELLVRVNGPSILYSAAREVIAATTGRGLFPAAILPSVSFLPEEQQVKARTKRTGTGSVAVKGKSSKPRKAKKD
ncbi:MAG TPA: hypothetical protein VI756_27400 [Blastocatellia bacterium]